MGERRQGKPARAGGQRSRVRRAGPLDPSHAQRKQILEELRRERDRVRGYLDLAGVLLVALNARGEIKLANRKVCQLLGVEERDTLGLSWAAAFVPEDARDEVRSALEKTMAAGLDSAAPVDQTVLTRRGEERIVSWSLVPVKDDAGAVSGILCTGEDVTDRRRVEEELRRSAEHLPQALRGTVQALGLMLEVRDPYTATHEKRVARIAAALARELGLPNGRVEGIRVAGLFHDIGKIYIPSEILNKPRKLTQVEYDLVKTHPQIGHDILKIVDFPWAVAQFVLQHHERMNGSGYPQGIPGDRIHLESRILAVADLIEIMLLPRPYSTVHGPEVALRILGEGRGSLYDSEVVAASLSLHARSGFALEGADA